MIEQHMLDQEFILFRKSDEETERDSLLSGQYVTVPVNSGMLPLDRQAEGQVDLWQEPLKRNHKHCCFLTDIVRV